MGFAERSQLVAQDAAGLPETDHAEHMDAAFRVALQVSHSAALKDADKHAIRRMP
jgi:hypothetical protein